MGRIGFIEKGFSEWPLSTKAGGVPGFGHLFEIYKNPLDFMLALNEHPGVVRVRLGTMAAYATSDHRLVELIQREDATFDKGGVLIDELARYTGPGIVTCPHAEHRAVRRTTQVGFRGHYLDQYIRSLLTELGQMTHVWSDGQVVDMSEFSRRLFSKTIGRIVFGSNTSNASLSLIGDAVDAAQEGIFRTICLSFAPHWFSDLLNRKSVATQRAMREAVKKDLETYRHTGADGLVDVWLKATDEAGQPLYSENEVLDQCVNVLFAGAETSAAVLPWIFFQLGQEPALSGDIAREMRQSLADGSPIAMADAALLPLMRGAVAETLRLNTPIWMLTRVTRDEIALANGRIPKGSTIIFSPYALQRASSKYPDPEAFKPSRWDGAAQTAGSYSGILTFGGGPRRCIGDALAMSALTLTAGTILRDWELQPLERPTTKVRATCIPGAARVRLSRRREVDAA